MVNEKEYKWVLEVVAKITNKMEWVSIKSKDKIPYTTWEDGTHDDYNSSPLAHRNGDGLSWWTNGFWGGMLWLMFHETKEEKYQEAANLLEDKLDQCLADYDKLHHDVGFMWLPSAVANYRITGNPKSRTRGMHAANLLAGRVNVNGQFIRAWNDIENEDTRGYAIIDCLFNIPLLYWASKESKDPRFEQIAKMHADTVMKHFIRKDGSVEHIVEFDPVLGGVVKCYGGQGYETGSAWTRGQAWALYGFMLSYIHTENKDYFDTAKCVAHYFISNIPVNGVIPVDFRQPKTPDLEDSTAAAIAACGLIEMAKRVGENEKELYMQAALKLLHTLEEKKCNWTKEMDCILEGGSESYHSKTHHIPIIYGDYFFMEAMFKLKGNDFLLF